MYQYIAPNIDSHLFTTQIVLPSVPGTRVIFTLFYDSTVNLQYSGTRYGYPVVLLCPYKPMYTENSVLD